MNFISLVKPVRLIQLDGRPESPHLVCFKIIDNFLRGEVTANFSLKTYFIYVSSIGGLNFEDKEGKIDLDSKGLNSKIVYIQREIEAKLTTYKCEVILSALNLKNKPEVYSPISHGDKENIKLNYDFISCIWNDGTIGERQSTKSLN